MISIRTENIILLMHRDDKVFESNSYRNSIREGRCLIFCDGFFEPHHYGKESQPYFCYLEESESYKEQIDFHLCRDILF